eukprot:scaffold103603_cov23-Tisochrysis_lutea.AAC.1
MSVAWHCLCACAWAVRDSMTSWQRRAARPRSSGGVRRKSPAYERGKGRACLPNFNLADTPRSHRCHLSPLTPIAVASVCDGRTTSARSVGAWPRWLGVAEPT